jgi:HEAT repeat protein
MIRQTVVVWIVMGLMSVWPGTTSRAADEQPDELVQMILKLLGDEDREFRAAGLDQIRSGAKGEAATKAFAAQLPMLDASAQVALLSALADRGDIAARPAVLELLGSSSDDGVRAAAISSLGKLGTTADLPLLVNSLSAKSDAEKSAARSSLARIRSKAVSTTLAEDIAKAAPDVKVALIQVLAARRARDVMSAFVAATVDENGQVRSAAMTALGQIGRPEQIAEMLPGVLKAENGGERDTAERNVALVCSRIENEESRGKAVIQALGTVDKAQADQLLSLVGRVGGKTLIDFVVGIATGEDAARRKLGIDGLSKWPDASVADKLLEITNTAADPAERTQAFRAYVKNSATRDNRSDRQRLDRMKQAMQLAKTPDEESFVINHCRTAYDVETLRFVLPFIDQPQFAQLACETTVELAHHRELREPNKAEFDKALDKVMATSKDPVVVDRAGRYKRGETWTRPAKSAE